QVRENCSYDYSIRKGTDSLLRREKLEKLDQTIDEIRTKYGMNSIKRAYFSSFTCSISNIL
ncbi:MAG TPA: hypothetical protein VHQ24_03480, partial [Lachnospiraceae bacterium]|nr:hypothetical protein [Lachnospiraceae bacterium]